LSFNVFQKKFCVRTIYKLDFSFLDCTTLAVEFFFLKIIFLINQMEEDQMDVVPLPNNHDAVFNIKIGDRRSRSFMPDFKDSGINFSINEGLNVLRAKLVHQTMPFVERWNSDRKKKDLLVFGDEVDIVVVTGHQLSAVLPRQTSWIALDPTAFHEQLRQIWNKVASSTVIPVSVKRNNPEEVLRLKTDRMESFAFHFISSFLLERKTLPIIGPPLKGQKMH
jgi:hypothetical protein